MSEDAALAKNAMFSFLEMTLKECQEEQKKGLSIYSLETNNISFSIKRDVYKPNGRKAQRTFMYVLKREYLPLDVLMTVDEQVVRPEQIGSMIAHLIEEIEDLPTAREMYDFIERLLKQIGKENLGPFEVRRPGPYLELRLLWDPNYIQYTMKWSQEQELRIYVNGSHRPLAQQRVCDSLDKICRHLNDWLESQNAQVVA